MAAERIYQALDEISFPESFKNLACVVSLHFCLQKDLGTVKTNAVGPLRQDLAAATYIFRHVAKV